MPPLERLARDVTDVEKPINGVGVLAIPPHESAADVIDVNASQLTVAVADHKHHRRVVAPRARRLVVATVTNHVRAAERTPRTKLVRNARRVGHRLAVDAVAKCSCY